MKLKLIVWRQASRRAPGKAVEYQLDDISPEMSFLEMLDVLNEQLIRRGEDQIAFESDCREGICGQCSLVVNGIAHGPERGTTVCQLHMRSFKDGDTIVVEPWRAAAMPVIKDLIVDRGALDRIVAAGGFISANVGAAPEANSIPVPRETTEKAMDAAACIQCGACVAACKNASAMLFTSAKVSQLARPHHRRRRLHFGQHRRRARSQQHSCAEEDRRRRHGRRRLHPVRRLRCAMQKRLSRAFHLGQNRAS